MERQSAVENLGKVEDLRIVPELRRVVTSDKDRDVRLAAVAALARIKEPSAADALLGALKDCQSEEMLTAVLDALGEQGLPKSAQAVASYMNNSKVAVAVSAIRAVGKIVPKELVPRIIEIYRKSEAGLKDANLSDEKEERCAQLSAAALSALNEITGQQFESPKEYEKWWAENAKRFGPFGGLKIMWAGSYETAFKEAAAKEKPVMLVFYADWCGWCKKLEKEVLSSGRIAIEAQNFVCLKVNADRDTARAKKYEVAGLPSVVFTDWSGGEVRRIRGFTLAVNFLRFMEKALEKANKQKEAGKAAEKGKE